MKKMPIKQFSSCRANKTFFLFETEEEAGVRVEGREREGGRDGGEYWKFVEKTVTLLCVFFCSVQPASCLCVCVCVCVCGGGGGGL